MMKKDKVWLPGFTVKRYYRARGLSKELERPHPWDLLTFCETTTAPCENSESIVFDTPLVKPINPFPPVDVCTGEERHPSSRPMARERITLPSGLFPKTYATRLRVSSRAWSARGEASAALMAKKAGRREESITKEVSRE